MQKHEREVMEMVERIAAVYHVNVEPTQGGKHLQLVFTAQSGRRAKMPVSSSPRADSTAQRNYARQAARRICDALVAV